MKNFLLGIGQIVIASVLINWIYNSLESPKIEVNIPDLSYPSPRLIETVKPTEVTQTVYKYDTFIIGQYDNFGTTLFYNLEDIKEYNNPDRSASFKTRIASDRSKSIFLTKGTRVEIIEYAYPFIKIRLWYRTTGWIKA